MGAVKVPSNRRQGFRKPKEEIYALYLAYRDPRTPRYARIFAACLAAYAFSPIDLIPDFVPLLGQLDDLVLIPLGLLLARRMIPAEVLEECRKKAGGRQTIGCRAAGRSAASAAWIIAAFWLLLAAGAVLYFLQTK